MQSVLSQDVLFHGKSVLFSVQMSLWVLIRIHFNCGMKTVVYSWQGCTLKSVEQQLCFNYVKIQNKEHLCFKDVCEKIHQI